MNVSICFYSPCITSVVLDRCLCVLCGAVGCSAVSRRLCMSFISLFCSEIQNEKLITWTNQVQRTNHIISCVLPVILTLYLSPKVSINMYIRAKAQQNKCFVSCNMLGKKRVGRQEKYFILRKYFVIFLKQKQIHIILNSHNFEFT